MFERFCFILLLNLAFYFKTLGYKYSSDDIPVYQNSPKDLKWWKRIYRQIEGGIRVKPQQDHAITMAIHAITSALIYTAFGCTDASFLAAILFSLNPINNQGSVWISGRSYTLPSLLILLSLSIPILSPVFLFFAGYYIVGLYSQFMVVASNHPYIVLAVPFVIMFHVKRATFFVKDRMSREMYHEDKQIKPEKLVLAIKTFGFYLTHSLIPVRTTFYHSFLQSAAGNDIMRKRAYAFDRFFFIGTLAIISIFTYWFTHKWDTVSFALLWWCVGVAPFCNLYRMSQEIAERYAYFPSVGLMVVLATVLINYPLVAALFIGVYATKTWFYIDAYQDDYWLVEYARLNEPNAWFAWHIAGMKRWDTGSHKEALIMWTMAKMISPKEMKILFNIATVLKLAGQHKEAAEYLAQAEANIPKGQEEEAKKIFDEWKKGNLSVVL